jgi:hypothetical protein
VGRLKQKEISSLSTIQARLGAGLFFSVQSEVLPPIMFGD